MIKDPAVIKRLALLDLRNGRRRGIVPIIDAAVDVWSAWNRGEALPSVTVITNAVQEYADRLEQRRTGAER